MDYRNHQPSWRVVLALAAAQHGVVAHGQLIGLGLSAQAIKHRVSRGRLHRVHRGVYAVGRPDLTREGWLMAAVLACGAGSLVSHTSAAELWGFGTLANPIEVSTRRKVVRPGIRAHRRFALGERDRSEHRGVAVTSPVRTLADLAPRLTLGPLERAINEADRLDVIHPPELRRELELIAGPGVARLRRVLDRRTFTLTDSELERRFVPIALKAGLPLPRTRELVAGFRVDFHWPALDLLVETDGLRYHRTAAEQARDRRRDQIHAAAGLTTLRFTHSDVAHDPGHVAEILRKVARRLVSRVGPGQPE